MTLKTVKDVKNGHVVTSVKSVINLEVGYYKFGYGKDVNTIFNDVYGIYIVKPTHDDMTENVYIKYMKNGKMRLATFEVEDELNYLKNVDTGEIINLSDVEIR